MADAGSTARSPDRRRDAPLSSAQERLWLIDRCDPGTAAYNVPLALRWSGAIATDALATALRAVITRHEALRTTYRMQDEHLVQVVGDAAVVALDVVDMSGAPEAADAARRDALARARAPFDLAAGPPLRCTVWTGLTGGDLLLLCMHHIAVDGWSIGILLEHLADAYLAATAGATPELGEAVARYGDYAAWDRAASESPAARRRLAERATRLSPYPARIELGGGAASPPASASGPHEDGQHVFVVPEPLWSATQEVARRIRATPFVILLAAFEVVVQRWSRESEFLVGTVMANRPRAEWQRLVGFFANTVPLCCEVRADRSFADLCSRARAEAFAALEHQAIPFDQLVAAVGRQRANGRTSLVQLGFGLQNAPGARTGSKAPWSDAGYLPTGRAKFELSLFLEPRPQGLTATIEYDAGRYAGTLAEYLGEGFVAILAAAIEDPDRAVGMLPLTRRAPGGLPPGRLAGERLDLAAQRLGRLSVKGAPCPA